MVVRVCLRRTSVSAPGARAAWEAAQHCTRALDVLSRSAPAVWPYGCLSSLPRRRGHDARRPL